MANLVGNQRSSAMFESTRGPSRKPVWAATNRSAASDRSVTSTKTVPPLPQPWVMVSNSTAFKVFPVCGHDPVQEVGDHQAHDRDGKGDGHVAHGALAGPDLRLPQNGQAVADRLDPRVGARAHAVGAQDEQDHAAESEFRLRLDHIGPRGSGDIAEVSQIHESRRSR